MKLIFLLGFILIPSSLLSVEFTVESQLKKLAPGWEIVQMAEGDLNKDDLKDFVLILSKQNENDKKEVTFHIYWGDGRGKLTPRAEYPQVVCLSCAGLKGGEVPFKMKITAGILEFTQFGGSKNDFEITTLWTLRNFDFALVGFSQKLVDANAEIGDISLIERTAEWSDSQIIEKVVTVGPVSDDGKPTSEEKITKCKFDDSLKKIRLRTFEIEKFEIPKCSNAKL